MFERKYLLIALIFSNIVCNAMRDRENEDLLVEQAFRLFNICTNMKKLAKKIQLHDYLPFYRDLGMLMGDMEKVIRDDITYRNNLRKADALKKCFQSLKDIFVHTRKALEEALDPKFRITHLFKSKEQKHQNIYNKISAMLDVITTEKNENYDQRIAQLENNFEYIQDKEFEKRAAKIYQVMNFMSQILSNIRNVIREYIENNYRK
jgi:phosphoglycerate-specific signal transduction histidine kinase